MYAHVGIRLRARRETSVVAIDPCLVVLRCDCDDTAEHGCFSSSARAVHFLATWKERGRMVTGFERGFVHSLSHHLLAQHHAVVVVVVARIVDPIPELFSPVRRVRIRYFQHHEFESHPVRCHRHSTSLLPLVRIRGRVDPFPVQSRMEERESIQVRDIFGSVIHLAVPHAHVGIVVQSILHQQRFLHLFYVVTPFQPHFPSG